MQNASSSPGSTINNMMHAGFHSPHRSSRFPCTQYYLWDILPSRSIAFSRAVAAFFAFSCLFLRPRQKPFSLRPVRFSIWIFFIMYTTAKALPAGSAFSSACVINPCRSMDALICKARGTVAFQTDESVTIGTMQKWLRTTIRSHFLNMIQDYPAIFSQNRIKMVATCARVALPCGFSVVPVTPVISSSAFAHCIAAVAYALISAASV